MRGFGTQLEQIQLLIDKIQHHPIQNAGVDPYDYEKLLTLSVRLHYSYGMALAHAYLAQYAQATMDVASYHTHLEEAQGISQRKNYFDVLIKCAELEGSHNSALCDEMTALSNYLEGLKLATETKDRKACFTFYKEIAELFTDCGAYEDAYSFHKKALGVLDKYRIPDGEFYRKHALICLLRLACFQSDLEKAEQYWCACQNVSCTLGNLPLLQMEEKIRLLLLRGEKEAATQGVEELLHALRHDKSDSIMLQPVYLYGLELLLHMKDQVAAAWCLKQIEKIYPVMQRKSAIRLQKLRVQYAEGFGTADDEAYLDFYQVAQQGDTANRVSTAETFRSLIALYETAKEQNRILEERTHLQTAIDQDELTQIYNRRYYNKMISKYLQGDRIASLSCVMIDVDFFKEYNDYYGHPKGDQLLKEVAALLVMCLPEGAYVARYGGDEFACLFVDRSEGELIGFVNRVRSELRAKKFEHVKSRSGNLLTLSFGIYCETNTKDCSQEQLLSRGDQALYQAKKNGRNTYAVYAQGREL